MSGGAPPAGAAPLLARPGAALLVAAGLAASTGVLAALSAPLAVAAAAALALGAAVVAHPALAAYAYLGMAPLLAGVDRGVLLPLARPSEALLGLLAVAVTLRAGLEWAGGRRLRPRLGAVDGLLLALAVGGSLVPLLSLLARGAPVTLDDALFALTFWKLLLLYWLVRAVVRTPRQVATCLAVTLAAVAAVAVVAVLQALQLAGVPELLAGAYAPFAEEQALGINRGTSTLASAHAVADVSAFAVAVALAWLARGGRPRWLLAVTAAVATLGVVAAGQFSGVVGLLAAVVAVAYVSGGTGRIAGFGLPVGVLAGVVLWPVVVRRLQGFAGGGVPESWVGRWENLTRHVWPELLGDWTHLLAGVRPAARLAAPEWWRDWIWIESGHTWLLWVGGVPLLAAFLAFLWVGLRATARVARARAGPVAVAAAGAFAALWTVALLSTLDAHLTLRGTADLLFPLLALASVKGGGDGAARLHHPPA